MTRSKIQIVVNPKQDDRTNVTLKKEWGIVGGKNWNLKKHTNEGMVGAIEKINTFGREQTSTITGSDCDQLGASNAANGICI